MHPFSEYGAANTAHGHGQLLPISPHHRTAQHSTHPRTHTPVHPNLTLSHTPSCASCLYLSFIKFDSRSVRRRQSVLDVLPWDIPEPHMAAEGPRRVDVRLRMDRSLRRLLFDAADTYETTDMEAGSLYVGQRCLQLLRVALRMPRGLFTAAAAAAAAARVFSLVYGGQAVGQLYGVVGSSN